MAIWGPFRNAAATELFDWVATSSCSHINAWDAQIRGGKGSTGCHAAVQVAPFCFSVTRLFLLQALLQSCGVQDFTAGLPYVNL